MNTKLSNWPKYQILLIKRTSQDFIEKTLVTALLGGGKKFLDVLSKSALLPFRRNSFFVFSQKHFMCAISQILGSSHVSKFKYIILYRIKSSKKELHSNFMHLHLNGLQKNKMLVHRNKKSNLFCSGYYDFKKYLKKSYGHLAVIFTST